LQDVAILILETGVWLRRSGEAKWSDLYLQPAVHAKLGDITIRHGKSKNAKRNLSLRRVQPKCQKATEAAVEFGLGFPGHSPEAAILVPSIDHQHDDVRDTLKLSKEFVVHSLRHTMLTRLAEPALMHSRL
jgi:hypothetical protein